MERRLLLGGLVALAASPAAAANRPAAAPIPQPEGARTLAASPEALRRLGERLLRLEEDGLSPAWYGLNPATAQDPHAIASGAAGALTDLVRGRVVQLPGRVDLRRRADPAALAAWFERIAEAEEPAAVLDAAAIRVPGTIPLKAALAAARARAEADWPSVPNGNGRVLDPGRADALRVPALRARLAATDAEFAANPGDGIVYDDGLLAAVRRFQTPAGLEPDGRVGAGTMAALNRAPRDVVDQLRVALDMRRAAAPAPRERHVDVNVPDFRLAVIEDGRSIMDMAVIVGRPDRATPMITTRLTSVQFNPPWGVPQRNAAQDLLPRLRRDPQAVAQRGFRIFQRVGGETVEIDPMTVDWHAIRPDRFPYFIRQDAGDANALGRLKFIMPNGDDIFLHDTPDRHLFRRVDRAYSSGCIRLERPMELLTLLLSGNEGWDQARADRVLASRQTIITTLRRALPIRLHYDTVVVRGNEVRVRQDIYGLDAAYARAMGRRDAVPMASRG
jgi:L,D-transpeptidase YcbB